MKALALDYGFAGDAKSIRGGARNKTMTDVTRQPELELGL